MKNQLFNILLIAIGITVFAACGSNAPKEQNQAENADVEAGLEMTTQTIELSVQGMTCTGCETAIIAAVGKIDGVKAVDAYHVDAIAVVKYDTTVANLDQIKNAISEAGYTPGDFVLVEDE